MPRPESPAPQGAALSTALTGAPTALPYLPHQAAAEEAGVEAAHPDGSGPQRAAPERAGTERAGAEARARARGAAQPDRLLHQDPAVAAEQAALEALLRCWTRETGARPGPDGLLRIDVLGGAARLTVPVRHWSACGWHRFDAATLAGAGAAEAAAAGPESPAAAGEPGRPVPDGAPVDAVTAAALLAAAAADRPDPGRIADLAARVADSVTRTADILAHRRQAADPAARPASPFLAAEQDLLLGHPLHPTPKSRDGLGPAQSAAYSPELRGSFQLHWYAVDRELLAAGSALTSTAEQLTESLLATPGLLPPGTAALPLHPWQARELALRPAVAALLADGRLHDLGPHGAPWYPTSSVRTVCRPGTPWMLKLSLGLRITNSRRENLRKELHRGLEVHRLLESGLGEEWRAAHPGFDIVRDPAWIGVDLPAAGGRSGPADPSGLDTVLRQQPFGPEQRALCVAGLVAEQPLGGDGPVRSRLGDVLRALSARCGRPLRTVATEWFLRYLDAVVLPVLWLDGRAGIALEAHQQNSLVLLDAAGWPVGGRYRDNQGYYFRDSYAERLHARLPGLGEASDTFVADATADERFAYYLGINHVLGLIGALGSQRLADEQVLLAALRRFLAGPRAAATGSALPAHLLEAATLRCKANLLTRLNGLDELVGPVETQSVYVDIANPVAAA
ncbi:siderophore biosynthesis protein [Kitasatospora sp. NBC_00240]|uniref:IucA/IucC family protein n=1 Tax=Kitasatospora sp. NBC_00240 TaxID=2903567 RepID=UPI00224EB6F7|nr:IucA/IucC family protein [Kitasatospora sp. NBC_00240]MCX5210536.1 siderophore biosynthesis protein [Kitasatospora sp. NBC_00240]